MEAYAGTQLCMPENLDNAIDIPPAAVDIDDSWRRRGQRNCKK